MVDDMAYDLTVSRLGIAARNICDTGTFANRILVRAGPSVVLDDGIFRSGNRTNDGRNLHLGSLLIYSTIISFTVLYIKAFQTYFAIIFGRRELQVAEFQGICAIVSRGFFRMPILRASL